MAVIHTHCKLRTSSGKGTILKRLEQLLLRTLRSDDIMAQNCNSKKEKREGMVKSPSIGKLIKIKM